MPHATGPVRVGLIGYGFAGKTFHAPLARSVAGLDLVAVASSDAAKVHADLPEAHVFPSPEALIADESIGLVIVATPNDTHAPLARAALEAGKHVVVDKPFALDLAEARDVVATAARVGRHLWVFHNRRWDSDFLTVKAAIAAGTIGRVVHFDSRMDRFRPEVRDRWRERAVPGAGLWYDLGPHLVDQALTLFGLPDRVLLSTAMQRDGAQADDWAHAILTYGERRVILQGAMLVAGGSPRFVVHGTGGSLVKQLADQQETQLKAGLAPGGEGWGQDDDPLRVYSCTGEQSVPATPGDQREFYRLVAAALEGDGQGPVRPIEALAVMAVIEAGLAAARDGQAAPLPLTADERASWDEARR